MSSTVVLCARQELMLAARSRWTHMFSVVFAILALLVAWSGYILSGGSGVQDFARTSASLLQLVILLVPLASLVIGVLSFSADRGTAEVLFAQPVSRTAILTGQMIGVVAALTGAQLIGFGLAGMVIFSNAGSWGIGGFGFLILSSVALTAVFVALAAAVSAGSVGRMRTKALAQALVVWFAAVVLFDVAALGAASFLPSGKASRLLMISVVANPVDAIRTGALMAISGTSAFGAASLAFLRFSRGAIGAGVILSASILCWIIAPAWLAIRRLTHRDL